MPIDFQLSESEDAIRRQAAAFAAGPLKDVRKVYSAEKDEKQFQALKPFYGDATAGGMIKSLVSPHNGGTGGSLIESAILVEEMYAVDPSASLTIFSTALGLIPFNLAGKEEHKEFLEPFLSGEGAPLASLVFSEPGGVANFVEKGAPGLNTTATLEGSEWVLNGEKV